jgi:hypothetical protein
MDHTPMLFIHHMSIPATGGIMTVEEAGNIVVIGRDGDFEVHRDLSDADVRSLVARRDEKQAEGIAALERRLAAVADEIVSDPDLTVEYYEIQAGQARRDDWFSGDLEELSAEEQTKRVDQYHRYTNVGSVLLYADVGFTGSSKFMTVTWPNFKWWPYRFNDRASSAKAWGVNVLFEHTWYRGRRLWLVGLPYFEARDFRELNFNDIASSFASLG